MLLALALLAATAAASHGATGSALLTYITGLGTSGTAKVVIAPIGGGARRTIGPANSALLRPDGTQVAAIRRSSATSWALLLYSTSAAPAPTSLKTSQKFMQLLAWSPDSRFLLFSVGATAAGGLWVFDTALPQSRPKEIAAGAFYGASFDPGGSGRIVYARAAGSGVDLYTTTVSGGDTHQLTNAGTSEYPVWGPNGIAYAHGTRSGSSTPQFQLWLIRPGAASQQLTSMKLQKGLWGLTPVAFSGSGTHLLANFVGQNTTEAYVLDLSASKPQPRDLTGAGNGTIGDAISRDGGVILVTKGRADNQAGDSVETVPWSGGKATVVAAHGAYASWNS